MTRLKGKLRSSSYCVRLLIVCVAMSLIGLAMACMSVSGIGSDSVTVLIDGVAHTAGVSQGTATILVSAVFLVFAFFFNRESIRSATIVAVLVMGPAMDVSLLLFQWIPVDAAPLFVKLLITSFGTVLLGFSIGLYLSAGLGSSPSDSVNLFLQRITHLKYKYCVFIFYAITMLVGWLLGGVVGVGTLIALVLVGWTADKILELLA